jgi:hypothetical protein
MMMVMTMMEVELHLDLKLSKAAPFVKYSAVNFSRSLSIKLRNGTK